VGQSVSIKSERPGVAVGCGLRCDVLRESVRKDVDGIRNHGLIWMCSQEHSDTEVGGFGRRTVCSISYNTLA
jgi:hypothetical protein